MNKFGVLFVSMAVMLAVFVVAMPSLERLAVDVNPSDGRAQVNIPSNAVAVAPEIFSLGSAEDVDGTIVEGFVIIDYKVGQAKPGTVCGNGICEAGENSRKCAEDCGNSGTKGGSSSCFAFFAKDAKWKDFENYIVDPSNEAGLGEQFVKDNIALNIQKWEDEAGLDIFDSEVAGVVDGIDLFSPDGKNEVLFGNITNDGAVGLTVVWGIFSGPPRGRELREWDQIYDDVDYNWSDSSEAGKMDFENVGNHELGHAFGIAHPEDTCTEETMYRFVSFGETKKRSLESGDIAGIVKLY